MVRPAGPRISSIRLSTLSPGMKRGQQRWVCSNEPMIAPAPDMPETNSTSRSSTTLAVTVPRPAMAWEISLISSSSSACQMPAWSSPSASSTTAAFSGPVRRVASTIALLLERGRSCGLMQPAAEDRDRLLRMLLDELGDPLDRARPSPGPRCGRCRCFCSMLGAGQGQRAGRWPGRLAICIGWPSGPVTMRARRRAAGRRWPIGPPPPPQRALSSGRTTKKHDQDRDDAQHAAVRRRA